MRDADAQCAQRIPVHASRNVAHPQCKFTRDTRVIEEGCACYTCRSGFSRAYLRHPIAAEILASQLATIHNCIITGN